MPTKEQYQEVLALFCTRFDSNREILKTPFIQNGFYYATDSYCLAQLSCDVFKDLPYSELTYLNVSQVINSGKWPAEKFAKIKAELISAVMEKVEQEDEYKKGTEKCIDCQGEGLLTCDLNEEHDCRSCGGDGTYPPSRKTGRKIPNPRGVLIFGQSRLSVENVEKLLKVCQILQCDEITIMGADDKGNYPPFFFQIKDFLICIMPLSGTSSSSDIKVI